MENQYHSEVRNEPALEEDKVVSERTIRTNPTVSGSLLVQRIISFVGGALMVLLVMRFLLFLFGASRASGFVDFIYSLSGVFVAPFNGIFSEPTYGTSRFDSATLVAILVYGIITVGLMKLVTLNKRDRGEV